MYPRQQSPATLERLNFPSYMEPLETADKLSEDCEEPPPDYFPQVDLPAYPGSPVSRNPPVSLAKIILLLIIVVVATHMILHSFTTVCVDRLVYEVLTAALDC